MPFENVEMEGIDVNEEAQSLKHGGLHPDAHVFLCVESRQVVLILEDGEDGEQQFRAHGIIPEFNRERSSIRLEGVE